MIIKMFNKIIQQNESTKTDWVKLILQIFYLLKEESNSKFKIKQQNNSMSHQYWNDSKSFKVFVRVRPFNAIELQNTTDPNYLKCETQSIILKNKGEEQTFTFDKIYNPNSTQKQIFHGVAEDIIDNALLGINGTIFCYGQTSSGKTHTIVGDYSNNNGMEGLVSRVLNDIYQKKSIKITNQKTDKIDIKIKLSMVQIYNEKVKDLLDLNKIDLRIRQNKKQGVFIENVNEKTVPVIKDAMSLIKKGIQNRTVGCTNLNAESSRSHMLFIITITYTNFQSGEVRSAKVTLVDLAGSQKVSKTGCQGKMLLEAKKINTSLLTLAKVIFALSQGKSNHIPYRDSKLTRILQQSIGGNCLTRLIINISPSQTNHSEIMTSLRFGHSAKMIKNCPKINKQYTIEELAALLRKAELKIQRQCKIIQQYKQLFDSECQCGNKIKDIDFDERSITMHIIPFEEEEEPEEIQEQLSLSTQSFCFISRNDNFNRSFNERKNKQCTFISNTSKFELSCQQQSKSLPRKPIIASPKYMKSSKMIAFQQNNLLSEQFQQRKRVKSSKYVKIRQQLKKIELKRQLFQQLLADIANKQNKPSEHLKKYSLQIMNADFITQIKQSKLTLKQQFSARLKKQLTTIIRSQLKQQIDLQLNAQILALKKQIQSLNYQMIKNGQKFKQLTEKYNKASGKLKQNRQTIKEKDIKIQGLKEKYQQKKHHINEEINKLKYFWQNDVKL